MDQGTVKVKKHLPYVAGTLDTGLFAQNKTETNKQKKKYFQTPLKYQDMKSYINKPVHCVRETDAPRPSISSLLMCVMSTFFLIIGTVITAAT